MAYFGDVQDTAIDAKLKAFVTTIGEYIGDNDEAVDARDRDADKLSYGKGFEWCASAWLSYYNSTGTGTPLHDKLCERLFDAQAAEWARQYPNRASLGDILSGDSDEFRDEAEEWETAAYQDEAIFIRVEATRADGDIKFRSCFMNEISVPYGDEFEVEMAESEFMALDSEGLESLGKRLAEAPYEVQEP